VGPVGAGAAPGRPAGGVRWYVRPDRRAVAAAAVLQADRDHRLDHGVVPRVRPGDPPGRPGPARAGRRRVRPGRLPRGPRAPAARRPARQGRPAPPVAWRAMEPTPLSAAKALIAAEVDRRAAMLVDVSHRIHARPELRYEERFAHDLLAGVLEREGLAVNRSARGV